LIDLSQEYKSRNYQFHDLFEEYKADEEFDASNVMDTPLRKAMRDAGMKESDFR
jgi:hypothetical protein